MNAPLKEPETHPEYQDILIQARARAAAALNSQIGSALRSLRILVVTVAVLSLCFLLSAIGFRYSVEIPDIPAVTWPAAICVIGASFAIVAVVASLHLVLVRILREE